MSSNHHNFTFPPIYSVNEKYGKNTVQQLFLPSITHQVSLSNLQIQTKHFVLLKDQEDNKYLLSNKKRSLNIDNYDKILYGKFDDILDIQANQSITYEWLKHPMKNSFTDSAIENKSSEALNSWKDIFTFKKENFEANEDGLRNPQIGAICSAIAHWTKTDDLATIVMPTGTGKTEVMISILMLGNCKKLLVTVPTDPLREQISNKFLTLGMLRKLKVIAESAHFPVVGVVNGYFHSKDEALSFFKKCNVVVSTMMIMTGSDTDIQNAIKESFSNLFIDEAHHSEASSWHSFRNVFLPNKVLQFTATPFRNDGKRLDGDIIYNFPLKRAQEENYFTKINFVEVTEFDPDIADKVIAIKAVEKLKEDLENGYDHILMARVGTKSRADFVLEIYQQFPEFNPVKLHTGISKQRRDVAIQQIINKQSRIIICVDMLGEGFDLPQLKIAALHDVRKSLPITLQLAGRFTRTKTSANIGEATFIANTGDVRVEDELIDLYSHEPDWNYLLQSKSEGQIQEEIDFKKFLSRFKGFKKSKIPLQNLFPAMSTIIYKNHSGSYDFKNFKNGLTGISEDDFIYAIPNDEDKTLVIVTGEKRAIEWGKIKDIYDTIWCLFVIYYDEDLKLLFINCSDNSSMYSDLANAIIGDNAQLIKGVEIFRCLSGISRLKLQNVGLKEILAKLIRYTQRTGTDIEQALSEAETSKAQKAVVFGVGYENGIKASIGCSYKGRIWSRKKCNVKTLTEWCSQIGEKILDVNINPDEVLKNTLTPIAISIRPEQYPVGIDWHENLYDELEAKYCFVFEGRKIPLYLMDMELTNPSTNGPLSFALKSDDFFAEFELNLSKVDKIIDYSFSQRNPDQSIRVLYGKHNIDIKEFLYNFPPSIWFVNGSSLTGIEYYNIKNIPPPFDSNKIIPRNWSGVNIRKESQGVSPKITDSIQYQLIQELMQGDYDIIYDDDGSGEIADIITIKKLDKSFKVELYHLKFAINGRTGKDLRDLYTICGQTQKSVNWKLKEGKEFFQRLLMRKDKIKGDEQSSRLEMGTIKMLMKFKSMASKNFTIEWKIYIVQPSISKTDMSPQQLELLGVTEKYLKERAEIALNVIGSA